MKRIITFLLAVMMVLCLAACQTTPKETEPSKTPSNQPTEPSKQQDTTPTTEATQPAEEWGVVDDFSVVANGKAVLISIKLPALTGIPKGTGLLAYQPDGTFVIVDGHKASISPEISSVDQVLPTCFVQTEMTLDLYRASTYKDFAFEIKSSEKVTVNGYEMCKYTGVHTFTFEGNQKSFNFVAYATQLKTNGGYVYWMVLDESEGQTLGQTIADHAYKMALSLEE
jgi:hypothetical protein